MPQELTTTTPIGLACVRASADSEGAANLSLSLFDFEPRLAPGMSVESSQAVVLAVSPKTDIENLLFEIEIGNDEFDGQPESGENLDAYSWTNDEWIILCGTEDAEAVKLRVGNRIRFKSGQYPIQCEANKVSIFVPLLLAGPTVHFHFALAWNRYPEPKELSCWFAVDIPNRMLVTGAS